MIATLALMAAASVATSSTAVHRYALVVGYNAPSTPARATLRYADDDAARFFEVVRPVSEQAYLLTVFDETSQTTFDSLRHLVRRPTLDEIQRVSRDLRAAFARDRATGFRSELWFYYAGHGEVRDGVGYVNLDGGAFARDDLKASLLGQGRADVTHVIVDACKSYFFVAGRGPSKQQRTEQTTPFAGPERISGVGYVLSTSEDADSHEWSGVGGGVFSHEVRSALLGAADVNADDSVDYDELAAFVAVANEAVQVPRFRPRVLIQPPTGQRDAALYPTAALKQSHAKWLQVGRETTGRIGVLDARGLRYLDVHKGHGTAMRIALLQPGRYDVRHEGSSFPLTADTPSFELEALSPDPEFVAARGEIHQAFEHLFGAPYDASVVRGVRLASTAVVGLSEVAIAPAQAERSWWPAITIGSGAVAVVAAGVLAGVAIDTRSKIDSAAQAEVPAIARRSDRYGVAAASAGVVGVVAIGSGLVAYMLDL